MNRQRYIADSFPLEQLFKAVREEGISLGIEELLCAQQALQYGLGGETASSLRELLKMLWLGSREEFSIFDKCFNRYLELVKKAGFLDSDLEGIAGSVTRSLNARGDLLHEDILPEEEKLPSPPVPSPPLATGQTEEASVSLPAGTDERPREEFLLVRQHDPSSPLSLRRNWQKLRSEHPTYAELDLDVEATIRNIARKGYFDEPVLIPRIRRELNLLLFVDAGGSMSPLMDYCNRWQEIVLANVRFKEARRCYFRNIPEHTVFLDKDLKEATPLRRFWANIPPGRTIALILSDVGAARKSWDSTRILECRDFSRVLHKKGIEQLWLNPMRKQWWEGNSAAKVAQYVPQMLPMDTVGTSQAISYLNQRMERKQP